MRVKDLDELHEQVHEVYESLLGVAFQMSSELAVSNAEICGMAYDLAFTAVIHEDDFFVNAVRENMDDLVVTENVDREKVKPAYADTLLMKEIIMHGSQLVTVFGNSGTLASVVLDYITKEDITMSDKPYGLLLNYISTECPAGEDSFVFVFSHGTDKIKTCAEYVLAQYYRTYSPSTLMALHSVSDDFSEKKIEHLLLDVTLEHLTRQKADLVEQMNVKDQSVDLADLLNKHKAIEEKRHKLSIALGRHPAHT